MPLFNRDREKKKPSEKKESRRDFRLSKIQERASLMLAKAMRWKWLAAVIGLLIAAYVIFKVTT